MILNRIISQKKKEIVQSQKKRPLSELVSKSSSYARDLRGFQEAVSRRPKINLIAEIKKASPSQGVFREDFQPVEIARSYESSGACALSVLSDKKFFQGDIAYLQAVRQAVKLPILRKDFIIDSYQLYESVCAGADAVLLIARLLSAEQLKQFLQICRQLNLAAVCEAHSEQDLDRLLPHNPEIIGINNRNLDTFAEDLRISARLMKKMPKDKTVISESAIKTAEDVKYLQDLGVNAVLIGETFMRSKDIAAKVKEIMRLV